MPNPNHPQLPLCCLLAAQPGRYLFPGLLRDLIEQASPDARELCASRLKGMLGAYMEMDVINPDQFSDLCAEIHAFAYGAGA